MSADAYNAELARENYEAAAIVVDGIVSEPMRITKLGVMPATVRITKVWKGPNLRSLQIHFVSNCESGLFERGRRLSFALLRVDELGMTDAPISMRLKLLFDGNYSDFVERWRLLFTIRQVFTFDETATGFQAYDRELRRLLMTAGSVSEIGARKRR